MLLWLWLGCNAPAGEPERPAPGLAISAQEPAAAAEIWPGDAADYPWLAAGQDYAPLWSRIPAPAGYTRAPLEGWPAWVRALPMKPAGSPVRTWRGDTWMSGADRRLLGVVELDVGQADLQQCADTVLRLRIEHLWQQRALAEAAGQVPPDIGFHYTSGDLSRWSAWAAGDRATIKGSDVTWTRRAAPSASRATFEAWTRDLFNYAGSLSLAREGSPVASAEVAPGDFLSLGGSPGHAVVVLDVARDAAGQPVVLIGEGFMPAMDLHVLAGPLEGWWPVGDSLQIPTWVEPFPWTKLRRFTES